MQKQRPQGVELLELEELELLLLLVELVLLAVVAVVADSEQEANWAAVAAPLEPNIWAQPSTIFLQAQIDWGIVTVFSMRRFCMLKALRVK